MLYDITMDNAKRIAAGDWMYFINNCKELPVNYGGRRKNTIYAFCCMFSISLKDGPDGKADRTGNSGFNVNAHDFDCSVEDLNISVTEYEGKSYLKVESGPKSWREKTILYRIKDGGQQ